MNRTSMEHLKEHFPDEDVEGFDKVYYSKGDEDSFVFVALKGDAEDIKVLVHGNYAEESLERNLFILLSRCSQPTIDYDVLEDAPEEIVKKDLLKMPQQKKIDWVAWSARVQAVLLIMLFGVGVVVLGMSGMLVDTVVMLIAFVCAITITLLVARDW